LGAKFEEENAEVCQMVNVHDYAHNLARALKDSPEVRSFATAKAKIKGNQTAEQMVGDIHKRQLDLQTLAMQGKEPSPQQKEALEQLFAVVQGHSDVRDYLMAEQRLGILMNDIYKIIGGAIDLDGVNLLP